MQTTRAMQYVRALAGKDVGIYNDKIKNGRSFKVWGWTVKDYEDAKAAMELAGFTAEVRTSKQYAGRVGRHYMVTRLLVAD